MNRSKYGLPREYYKAIKLPPKTELKVFKWDDVMNHRKNLSTIERIQILEDIEQYILTNIERHEKQL